jgi:hypothetical protein
MQRPAGLAPWARAAAASLFALSPPVFPGFFGDAVCETAKAPGRGRGYRHLAIRAGRSRPSIRRSTGLLRSCCARPDLGTFRLLAASASPAAGAVALAALYWRRVWAPRGSSRSRSPCSPRLARLLSFTRSR